VAYTSLIAMFFTVTNFVPVSAIGFLPIIVCGWRFFGRSYPVFMTPLLAFCALAVTSTLFYDPESFLEFDFYRHDGNLFVSYAPIFAGCVYAHRWDLNKVLKWFFVFAITINLPFYAWYLEQNGMLSIFRHPTDTFGSYFIARNAAGGFLAMLFCLGVACYLQHRSRLILPLIVLNGLMLFSTYSRGSLLGIIAVMPYLLCGRRRWMLGCMLAGIIATSLAISVYYTVAFTDYMGYMFSIDDPDAKVANLDIRYEWLWPRALAYFRQSPIVGLGFGSFDDHISQVVKYFDLFGQPLGISIAHTDSHAHNSYLNILAELGAIGLALVLRFYWLLIIWCQENAAAALNARGRNISAYRFVELSAVCLLAMAATEHRLTTPSNALILTLVLSLLLASRNRDC
jgi:O-antigen ligase